MSLHVIESGTIDCIRFPISVLETMSVKHTVFKIFDFRNAVTFKTGLEVRQGHLKYHHSIERIRLPIDVL